jgi:hypothetical protein
MAWAGKTLRLALDGTAQVRANQTEGSRPTGGMDDNCRDFRSERAGINGKSVCRSEVEIGGGQGVSLGIQETEQTAQAKQAAEGKERGAGQFQKITTGYVRHLGYR